jgi:LacI family transcriptional regulator
LRGYRKATIKDVAEQAQVSKTTVSHYVSGRRGACSTETAERIQEVIDRLHYTPSLLTHGLRDGRTNTLGVSGFTLTKLQDNYLQDVWSGLLEGVASQNYALLFYPESVSDGDDYRPYLDGRVDGVVIYTSKESPVPEKVAAAGMPIVAICGGATVNENDTVDLALTHLWELGHRRIAHVAGPDDNEHGLFRYQNYVSWTTARKVYDPELVAYEESWIAKSTESQLRHWLELASPPTAVFCANDNFGLAMISAAKNLGVQVPEDLSIVGVDNFAPSADSLPPLTTVDIPQESVGREAVFALLRLMSEAPIENCRVLIPVTTLVVRGTTGPPRRP